MNAGACAPLSGQIALRFENRYRCKDGSYRWLSWSSRPYDEQNLVYAVAHDITDQKQAQLNDRFLYELTQRLLQFADAEAMQWETLKSLGEYLNVDRATWSEIDGEQRLATVDRDWYREGLSSYAGVYQIADFIEPALQAAMLAGRSVTISDVTADPSIAPYLSTYQQLGIGAVVNIPCLSEGRWVATLNVNTPTARIWRDDEVALMQAVVAQLWSLVAQTRAIQALRVQEQQTRAAKAIIKQQLGEIEAIYLMAPIGLCFVDTDLRFVRINEQLAAIDGSSVTAHQGRTLREMLPSLAHQLEPLYQQVIASGEPILNLELSGMTDAQPGVLRHWLVCYYPQKDAANRLVGVNAMVQEISLRKRQEAALLQSERKFSAIFNQTFQLMGLVSLDGVLLEVNQAALDSIAAPESEIVGKSFWDAPWWHTEQLQQQLKDAIASAASGQFVRYEVEFPNPSGGATITDFSLKPIFDEIGRVEAIVAEAHDITERKQAQADLEQRNQELDSFVYVVSHDLKAPLRAIANLSEWIEEDLEGSLSVANQQQMTLLRSRVYKMQSTIDGLLDYTRIGITVETIESVSIAKLLAEVID